MSKHRWVFKPSLWITLVTLLGVTLLCGLGCWQLLREKQKLALQNQANEASTLTPLNNTTLLAPQLSWEMQRYRSVHLQGTFLNQYSILLDNKIKNGQVGYHLITPVALTNDSWLLIDRGFIPLGKSRQQLPTIPAIIGEVTIEGYLDFSYRNPFISNPLETQEIRWPLRMQHLDVQLLSTLWHKKVFPMLVVLNSSPEKSTAWLSPERHRGYAVQWFGLAITLLLFSFFFQLQRENNYV
ncbi:SURF1 family cytochrome oxidase biogenesis protein [Candidatus Berkiella aquae]|uniref:SURF1-like protein n=1 Tax=Candidatus Berkiella aquae TaxID=295108 RepID=A0A0Q9YJX0_9GAMM|nr:SURF1 family protein [Candidatus Berkiella aquae]MCS5710081.1 SURF1 family protein [Candidatus Berkiella aquae]